MRKIEQQTATLTKGEVPPIFRLRGAIPVRKSLDDPRSEDDAPVGAALVWHHRKRVLQRSVKKIKWVLRAISSAVERFVHIEDVSGSNPLLPTIKFLKAHRKVAPFCFEARETPCPYRQCVVFASK